MGRSKCNRKSKDERIAAIKNKFLGQRLQNKMDLCRSPSFFQRKRKQTNRGKEAHRRLVAYRRGLAVKNKATNTILENKEIYSFLLTKGGLQPEASSENIGLFKEIYRFISCSEVRKMDDVDSSGANSSIVKEVEEAAVEQICAIYDELKGEGSESADEDEGEDLPLHHELFFNFLDIFIELVCKFVITHKLVGQFVSVENEETECLNEKLTEKAIEQKANDFCFVTKEGLSLRDAFDLGREINKDFAKKGVPSGLLFKTALLLTIKQNLDSMTSEQSEAKSQAPQR